MKRGQGKQSDLLTWQGRAMVSIESNTHAFILKIWLEETPEDTTGARWRGHITHAYTGDRCYLQELEDIIAFVAPYLAGMEVKLRRTTRLALWFNSFRQHRAKARSTAEQHRRTGKVGLPIL